MKTSLRLAAFLAVSAASTSAFSGSASASPLHTLTVEATVSARIDQSHEAPFGLAYEADGDYLWAVNNASDSVTVRDAADMRVVRRIAVGHKPQFLALDEVRHLAFVVNSGDNSLSRIDTISQRVEAEITVGQEPQMAVVDEGNGAVWVSNRDSNTVSVVLRGSDAVRQLRTGKAPVGIALDVARHRVFVANSGGHSLSVFDSQNLTRLDDIELPGAPLTVAVNAQSGVVCSTLAEKDAVALTVPGESNRTIGVRVGENPVNVICQPQSGLFFVSNQISRSLSVLDNNGQVWDEYPTGQDPIGLAIRTKNSENPRVFVAASAHNTLYCFDIPAYASAKTVNLEKFGAQSMLNTVSINTIALPVVPDSLQSSRETIAALPSAPSAAVRARIAQPKLPSLSSLVIGTLTPHFVPVPGTEVRGAVAPRLPKRVQNQGQGRLPVFPASVNARYSQDYVDSPTPQSMPMMPTSNLFGGVKAHVAQSGLNVKQLFAVKTIFGVAHRGGASEHPGGLALDFCVGTDKAKGDQIAAYMIQNAAQHRVSYVIWNQQIRHAGDASWGDMKDRGSITANHKDHVHVSYFPAG